MTVEDIWEEVKNTDIHNIADEYCKFVLNVFVAPYPNFICSVWVYIAALFDDPYEMHGY